MREGYGSRSVRLSVRLSVTALAATYLVYMLKQGTIRLLVAILTNKKGMEFFEKALFKSYGDIC